MQRRIIDGGVGEIKLQICLDDIDRYQAVMVAHMHDLSNPIILTGGVVPYILIKKDILGRLYTSFDFVAAADDLTLDLDRIADEPGLSAEIRKIYVTDSPYAVLFERYFDPELTAQELIWGFRMYGLYILKHYEKNQDNLLPDIIWDRLTSIVDDYFNFKTAEGRKRRKEGIAVAIALNRGISTAMFNDIVKTNLIPMIRPEIGLLYTFEDSPYRNNILVPVDMN